MTNYREILRLSSLGYNNTEIADGCGCSRTTVISVLRQAEAVGVGYPLPEGMSERDLINALRPPVSWKPVYRMPDYAKVHKEYQRKCVTLNRLWLEYCEDCQRSGELPYQLTQFKKYYREYTVKAGATMHLDHKPGEIMQVDWAGDTAKVIDTDTGELIPAYLFVAVLPYSGYAYSVTVKSIVRIPSAHPNVNVQFRRRDCSFSATMLFNFSGRGVQLRRRRHILHKRTNVRAFIMKLYYFHSFSQKLSLPDTILLKDI